MPDPYELIGDDVYRAQFRRQRDAFRAAGIEIAVEPFEQRDAHFTYVVGRILVRTDLVSDPNALLARIVALLPGSDPAASGMDGLVVVTTGNTPVPEALDLLEDALADDIAEAGEQLTGPDTVVSITPIGVSHCPGTEPERPCPPVPFPPPSTGNGGAGVHIVVPDVGLAQIPPAPEHNWLQGVDGQQDMSVDVTTNPPSLTAYAGHGTFIAGLVRSVVPGASVRVTNAFPYGGATRESDLFTHLTRLLGAVPAPQIISLSAGAPSRKNHPLLAGQLFSSKYLGAHPETVLVAAAGNNSSKREFWPAAHSSDAVVGVGALGADEKYRAWFSNYGKWIKVWAQGEGLVNAFASGLYTYEWPPKEGFQQEFEGMARWSGTSFATPIVAGIIADRMSRTNESSRDAAKAVLVVANHQMVPGAGPMVLVAQRL